METQENKNSEKKEITYPKFIQERLDRIPWEELESQYGIKKDYIMSHEQIARQLANGQVTDDVNCYARVAISPSWGRWPFRRTSGATVSR